MFPGNTNLNFMKYMSFHSHFQIKYPTYMKHEERERKLKGNITEL